MRKIRVINQKRQALLLLVCGAPLLNACGGGGGDSGGNPPAAEQATPVAINESNQQLVASAALSSGDLDAALDISAGVQAQAASPQPSFSLKDLAKLQIDLANARQGSGAVLPASVQGTSQPCPAGGSMTINPVEGTSPTDPRGSGADISYSNCQIDSSFALNGSASFRVTEFGGAYTSFTPPYNVKMKMGFTKLAVTLGQDTSTLNGNFVYDMNVPVVNSMTIGLSGSQFSIDRNNEEVNTLNDFSFNAEMDLTLSQSSITQKGRIFSSALNGFMDFNTIDPFLFKSLSGNYPVQGKMKIAGANSTLFVTAQADGQFATLELDTDNNGAIDTTTQVLWSELE